MADIIKKKIFLEKNARFYLVSYNYLFIDLNPFFSFTSQDSFGTWLHHENSKRIRYYIVKSILIFCPVFEYPLEYLFSFKGNDLVYQKTIYIFYKNNWYWRRLSKRNKSQKYLLFNRLQRDYRFKAIYWFIDVRQICKTHNSM